MTRHSRTDRPGSGSDSCKTTPTRSRQAPPAVAGSCPRTHTCPAVRRRKPSRISTVVVLPAPFGPRNAKTSPRRTSRSTPATTSRPAYRLTRPRTLTTTSDPSEPAAARATPYPSLTLSISLLKPVSPCPAVQHGAGQSGDRGGPGDDDRPQIGRRVVHVVLH